MTRADCNHQYNIASLLDKLTWNYTIPRLNKCNTFLLAKRKKILEGTNIGSTKQNKTSGQLYHNKQKCLEGKMLLHNTINTQNNNSLKIHMKQYHFFHLEKLLNHTPPLVHSVFNWESKMVQECCSHFQKKPHQVN